MRRIGERNLRLTNATYNNSPFPQMRLYEEMPAGVSFPYSMMGNPPNFRSKEINTDIFGYRASKFRGQFVNLENAADFTQVNILLGGSTVFGVGSSSDATTIPSLLSDLTGEPWLNFGVRAAVSFQEYIHFIQHFKKVKKLGRVVFFSGMNDIYRNLADNVATTYDKRFQIQNELYAKNSARRIAYAYAMSLIMRKEVNEYLTGYEEGGDFTDLSAEEMGVKNLEEIFDRNFHLYSALAEYSGFGLAYFIQPLFPLTGKNGEEREIASILRNEQAQAKTNWASTKARIINEYQSIRASMFDLAGRYRLPLYDTNSHFNTPEALFVDNVHLSDAGSARAAEVIYETL